MADNKLPNAEKKNKTDNAFVKVVKAIFVRDIVVKLICLGASVALWLLAVGLGVSNVEHPELGFFEGFGANIAYEFSSPGRIIISIIDVLAIFLIAYVAVTYLRKNNSTPLIKLLAIGSVICLVLTSSLVSFPMLGNVFGGGLMLIVIIAVILFPHELRRFIIRLASRTEGSASTSYDCTEEELCEAVGDIVNAVLNMSKDNTGALIILTNQSVPAHILESGTELGAKLSQSLIECLFNTNADLHDGAVFIRGNRVLSAGCFLPLSQNQSLPKELGTRHRAALGVTEQYDVTTIVVSEETGVISVARGGKLDRYYDAVMLTDVIEDVYGLKAVGRKGRKKRNKV